MINGDTQASATQAAYYYQNLFAAREALALLDSTTGVERITVEMEGATHIDDVTVVRKDSVIFHQVKYTGGDPSDPLTNADLFAEDQSGRSLWQKLLRGWIAVRAAHGNVQIRLVTNRPLSTHASKVRGQPLPSLQETVARLLVPCRESVESGIAFEPPPDLEETWEILRRAARLTSDFEAFVAALKIVPSIGSVTDISGGIRRTLEHLTGSIGEADALFHALMHGITKAAAAPVAEQRSVNREGLERLLGLAERRTLRHRHELALPQDYVAFGNTTRSIWEDLVKINKGYVFVRGVAGSGKTIAVTALLLEHSDIHLRYYTYHPDQKVDRSERVTGSDFYFDLLLQLAQRLPGIYQGPRYPSLDSGDNRRLFWTEVYRLVDQHIRPFIIVIDGLDHAARVRPEEAATFLGTLPHPDNIPDGLKIVLVGQPDWPAYPPWLADPQRVTIIDMPKMTTADIERYLIRRSSVRGDILLDSRVVEALSRKTAGNPLSVWIAVNCIAGLTVPEIITVVESEGFPGADVPRYYEDLWRDIEREPYFQTRLDHLRRVQALLLVIREPVSAELLSQLLSVEGLDVASAMSIIILLKPLLVREGQGWIVALNDFRVFLQSRLESVEIREAHRRVATLYQRTDTDASHCYLAHHLYHSADAEALWSLVRRDRIHAKLLRDRDHAEIIAELEFGWRAAFDRRNVHELFRIGLLLMEETGRGRVLKDFADAYRDDEPRRDAERLLRSFPPLASIDILDTLEERTSMLIAAQRIFDSGLRDESEVLFEKWAITPQAVLSAVTRPEGRHHWQEPGRYLSEWFCYWIRVDQGYAAQAMEALWLLLDELAIDDRESNAAYRVVTNSYMSLLSSVVSVLSPVDAYRFFGTAASRGWHFVWTTITGLINRLHADGNHEEALNVWHGYVNSARGNVLPQMLMLGIQLGLRDDAQSRLSALERPDRMALWTPGDGAVDTWHAFTWVYVRAYFDVSRPLSAFVPVEVDDWAGEDGRYAAVVRAVSLTAAATARLRRNADLLSTEDFVDVFSSLITTDSRSGWSFSNDIRIKLARYFTQTISATRPGRLDEVAAWLLHNVFGEARPRLPDELIVLAIEILWASGLRDKALDHLASLSEPLGHLTAEARVRRLTSAATLADSMDRTLQARDLRRKALLAAVGPGFHEDFQLDEWTLWTLEGIRRRRDEGLNYAHRFAYYAALLADETEGQETMDSALNLLIGKLFVQHPKAATELLLALDDTWRASSVNSSILKSVAKNACLEKTYADQRNTRAASLLLMVAFLSDPATTDRDRPISTLRRTLAARANDHGDTRLAEILTRRFDVAEWREREAPGSNEAQREQPIAMVAEGVRRYFAEASELELVFWNYSAEQRAAFEAASQLEEGVDLYLNALDRVRRTKPGTSPGSPFGILVLLGRLLRSRMVGDDILRTVQLCDEHMSELLQYSILDGQLNVPSQWSFSDQSESLEQTVRLLLHLLESRCSRVVLEASRGLSFAGDFDLACVLDHVARAVGTRSRFLDRWLAHILIGLGTTHGRPVGEAARDLAARLDPQDIVTMTLIERVCRATGVQSPEIRGASGAEESSRGNVGHVPALEFPPSRPIVSTEDDTLGDNYVSSLSHQIVAQAKRIAETSGINVEQVRSLIEAETTVSDTKVPYVLTSRCGSMFADHDAKLCAARVVSRLLESGRIEPRRRQAVVQALRGTDPCLLLLSPNDVPDCISRLEDTGGHVSWVNGADLARVRPFRDHGPWRLAAVHSEQATEHRYESVTSITAFADPQLVRRAIDPLEVSDLRKQMFSESGTFGVTLDTLLQGQMWESRWNALPMRHVTEVVGGLVPIKQAMLSVCPTAAWLSLGLRPVDSEFRVWTASGAEVFRFSVWDSGDVTEFSYDTSWVGWGQVWLIDPAAAIALFPRPRDGELTRLSRIQRAVRTNRHEPFVSAVVREHWLAETFD